MQSFLKNIGTPDFWISVVFVGIAINLFSAALLQVFPVISKKLLSVFLDWSHEAKERKERILAKMLSSKTELDWALHEMTYLKLDLIFDYAQAAVFLLFALMTKQSMETVSYFCSIVAGLLLVRSLRKNVKHGQFSLLTQEAQFVYRERETHESRLARKSTI